MSIEKIDEALNQLALLVERDTVTHTLVPEGSSGVTLNSVLPKMKEIERYWSKSDENRIDYGDGRVTMATTFKSDEGPMVRVMKTWAPSKDQPFKVTELYYAKTDSLALKREDPKRGTGYYAR